MQTETPPVAAKRLQCIVSLIVVILSRGLPRHFRQCFLVMKKRKQRPNPTIWGTHQVSALERASKPPQLYPLFRPVRLSMVIQKPRSAQAAQMHIYPPPPPSAMASQSQSSRATTWSGTLIGSNTSSVPRQKILSATSHHRRAQSRRRYRQSQVRRLQLWSLERLPAAPRERQIQDAEKATATASMISPTSRLTSQMKRPNQ